MEDDVVGLGETHDEDQVDDKESEEIFGDHPVDHDHKGADDLDRPGIISNAGKQGNGTSKISEILVFFIFQVCDTMNLEVIIVIVNMALIN